MYWLVRPWRHAFDFSGRSPRREYWLFVLQTYVLILVPAFLLFAGAHPSGSARDRIGDIAGTIMIAALVLSVIPGLAVAVRRLHDQNKPGVFLLLGLVPGIGGLILLFFMLMDGDDEENDYGPNPLDRTDVAMVRDIFE